MKENSHFYSGSVLSQSLALLRSLDHALPYLGQDTLPEPTSCHSHRWCLSHQLPMKSVARCHWATRPLPLQSQFHHRHEYFDSSNVDLMRFQAGFCLHTRNPKLFRSISETKQCWRRRWFLITGSDSFILWHSEANLDKTLAREEFWGSASASSFPVLSCRFELSAFKEKDRREEFCFRTSATALPTSPEVPQCCTCKVKCFLIWKASQD